jgi:hypothetical protein
VLVTSEGGPAAAPELRGQLFDLGLQPLSPQAGATALTSYGPNTDFQPGEILRGHRLLWSAPYYYAGFSTASGTQLSLLQVRTDLVRNSAVQVVTGSARPTNDFFLVSDGQSVTAGVRSAPSSYDLTSVVVGAGGFGARTPVTVGGDAQHLLRSAGAGAAWHAQGSYYELWTPDTLNYLGPSDLHRTIFDATWTAQAATTVPADTTAAHQFPDAALTETMPTAVTVVPPSPEAPADARTPVTVVHFVVADSPPFDINNPGPGTLVRVLFDSTGAYVPGSYTRLPQRRCNRPATCISGDFLYLGYETATGATVERYRLLTK